MTPRTDSFLRDIALNFNIVEPKISEIMAPAK